MSTGPTDRSIRTRQLAADESTERPTCGGCGVVRTPDERFCESCGHDHALRASWSVEVCVDRAHFDRVAEGLAFPPDRATTVIAFEVDEIVIGRRNEARRSNPDIDLSGDLADPAVSHLHAAIRRGTASGEFTLIDLGSVNGTMVNHGEPVEPHQEIPLAADDRVYVGAWTVIRIVAG